ncbi:MAG: transglutaminase domain-containing protein [Chloroflexi bacterium]|nr:transglutaminase domain-containing protein [Chloroflexota bacterium]
MLPLLLRLLRRIRPREGWLILLLSLVAVLCLPASLLQVRWVQGSSTLVGLALLAALLGMALATWRFPGWLAGALMAVLGLATTVGFVGRTLPPLRLVLDEWAYAFRWLWRLPGERLPPFPFQTLVSDVARRLGTFGNRLWWWTQGVARGGAQQDNLVFLFLVALLVWAVSGWAGWWVYRQRRVLLALLPTGALLATNVFFADEGQPWLLCFLGCLTALLIAVRLAALEQRWTAAGTDYSEEVRLDLAFVGAALTIVVLGVSVAVPAVASRRTAEWFWRHFSKPWEQVEETAERLFPELQRPARSPLGGATPGAGGLPRAHLLGGDPALSTRVALRVWAHEPPPDQGGQQHYWRAHTYAVYNGRGWDEEELQALERRAGEPWLEEWLVGRRELLQTVQVIGAAGNVLYGAGEPLAPDRPYRALLRDERDLAALQVARRAEEYTILSAVPAVSEETLREAGETYPDGVLERYLQLEPLPQRVTELAQQLVAGAETPYDRALALESYLRTIAYTLDVAPPPPERDVVDVFLFDLREGYCDYYATAMAVLARSVGLPARLAVGYASGRYDEEAGFFQVTEEQAHSWVEVYFPRYGWIPFEPTAARATFERRGGLLAERPPDLDERLRELREQGEFRQFREALQRWSLWLGIGGAALAAGAAVWAIRRRRREAELSVAQRLYLRLTRWSARLGRRPVAHETPAEFARGLADRLTTLAAAARWGRSRLWEQGQAASREAGELASVFVRAQYSLHPLTEAEQYRAQALWQRLQRRLWTLWMTQWLAKTKAQSSKLKAESSESLFGF